jgi:cytochrome b561
MPGARAYSKQQIALHWLSAALVLAILFTHESFLASQSAITRGQSVGAVDSGIRALHIFGGAVVLPLVMWRFVLRLRLGSLPTPARETPLLRLAAAVVHEGLYFVVLVLPITGLMLFWNFAPTMARWLHMAASAVLFVLVFLHIGAAFVHHFFWKTDVFVRMLRPRSSQE